MLGQSWSLKRKMSLPTLIVIGAGGIGILIPLLLVQNQFLTRQIPRDDRIEQIGLKVTELQSEVREYLVEGRPGTLDEIEEIKDDFAEEFRVFRGISNAPEALEELENITEELKTVSREIVRLRHQFVERERHLHRQHKQLTQFLQGLPRDQTLVSQVGWLSAELLAYIYEIDLIVRSERRTTNRLENHEQRLNKISTTLSRQITTENAQRINDFMLDIRNSVHQCNAISNALVEELEKLEDAEQASKEVLSQLRRQALNDMRKSLMVGIMSVASVILIVLITLVFINVRTARRICSELANLAEAAKHLGKQNLGFRLEIHRKDELGKLAKSFNAMAERLQQSQQARQRAEAELLRQERLAALGKLTGTVSHELRNPLGTIKTSVAVVKKLCQGQSPMLDNCLELLNRNIDRCNNIIGDLLNFTRARKPDLRPTELDSWLRRTINELSLPEKIDLVLELNADGQVAIDEDHMRRAIVNLVENACQAMLGEIPEQVSVNRLLSIATRIDHGKYIISVSDNGPGIDPKHREQIFEPLFSTKSFGVGLGLPTVQNIIEEHGGEIEVFSEPGQGTKFSIWLPHPNPAEA